MSTASLNLLKGAKKKALEDEVETPKKEEAVADTAAAPAEAEGEEVKVDVDKLTGKEIDSLVSENEIAVPGDWKKMKVDEKRSWLKKEFNDDGGAETPETGAASETDDKAEAAKTEAAPADETPAEEAKPAAKSNVKIGKKGTAVAKSTVKEGEIIGPDKIGDIAQEIENMKEADARNYVGQLAEQTEVTYFKLGGILSLIQANGWYTPYANFREFVEGEHGINYRKAMYLISIYNSIVESGVSYEKVKHLGWTKLKELAPVLTKDNVDEWLKKVKDKTALQIAEMVIAYKKSSNTLPSGSASNESVVTTKTFKLHTEQKETVEAALKLAKKAGDTDVDSVALEYICLQYINTHQSGGSKAAAPADLATLMKGKEPEEVLTVFGEIFPDVKIEAEI